MASSHMLLCVLLLCSYSLTALGGGNEQHGFVVVPTTTGTSTSSNPACSPAPQGNTQIKFWRPGGVKQVSDLTL
jgi:hypothetical protein